MSTSVAWAISILLLAAWLVVTLRFRTGRHRVYLRWYRSSSSPRALRNFPIVGPVFCGLILPLLVAANPIVIGSTSFPGIDPSALVVIVLVAGTYFFLSVAATAYLLYRPPLWLVPRWLREEDAQIGYVSAPADWFDKVLLGGLGSLSFMLGVILAAGTVSTIVGGGK